MKRFQYQTFAWSLGTTSFRMADFHRKIEEQLMILDEFWKQPENKGEKWDPKTQCRYYNYAFIKGFITGKIKTEDKKSKTAREKTSGLVDIGLIDSGRKLTDVGIQLLKMVQTGEFPSDNDFKIPSDSFLYLKQMIKTSCRTQKGYVRPFLVTGKVLRACNNYLTDEEFTYLLPLCVDDDTTKDIISRIRSLRSGQTSIEEVISEVVLSRYNYPVALSYWVNSNKSIDDVKTIGMNRKSPDYDEPYATLYNELCDIYVNKNGGKFQDLLNAVKQVKNLSTHWKALLFDSTNKPRKIKGNEFDTVQNEGQLARLFFKYLHLFKAKSTLQDYKDLNRRYLKVTDAFIFENAQVKFTPIFESFFESGAKQCFDDAYNDCSILTQNVPLDQINQHLTFEESGIIRAFNQKNQTNLRSLDRVYEHLESERYIRFKNLIDAKFPDNKIIDILKNCEDRSNDNDLIDYFGGEADVPTIFEYIVAVAWYRMSDYYGKILDYMKLSISSDFLPITHAGGGEADIVYDYEETDDYPKHTLLIECTLLQGTGQRHGEMEPVSRHLSNYMIDVDPDAYCAFVTNSLHASVVSDFRVRKGNRFYRNDVDYVETMKIIPLQTSELKTAIKKKLKYRQIYKIFEDAFSDTNVKSHPQWYKDCVKSKVDGA